MIGEDLYQLTPRDEQVTWLEQNMTWMQLSASQSTISTFFVVPQNRVLILDHIMMVGEAGATQTTDLMQALVYQNTIGGALAGALFIEREATSPVRKNISRNFQKTMIGPGQILWMGILFSAAVNPNFAQISTNGLLIPRGNMAF